MPYVLPVASDPARDILLVKAVEHAVADALSEDDRTAAAGAAGLSDDGAAWFARRARHLLLGPLREYAPFAKLAVPPRIAWLWAAVLGLAAGAASSVLGPQGQVHVLFNPLVLVIVWNLGMYALLAGWRLARAVRGMTRDGPEPHRGGRVVPRPAKPNRRAPWLSRWILGRWWSHRIRSLDFPDKVRRRRAVLAAFGREWLQGTRPAWTSAVWRAMHVGAIGLAIGAFAGTYVRGLGLQYDFVWRSTFVTDPDAAAALLRWTYGPACSWTGAALPDRATALALMSPAGLPAAPWIHLLAVSAIAFVLVPRGALLVLEIVRGSRTNGRVTLDLADPYWCDTVEDAANRRLAALLEGVRTGVRAAAPAFLDDIEGVVASRLYDERIAPRLRAFRETGGRIADLRADLETECAAFAPTLSEHLTVARPRFEEDAAREIAAALDSEAARNAAAAAFGNGPDFEAAAQDGAQGGVERVGASIGRGIGDRGAAIAGSTAAAVAGSLAGGFGAHLGTAVLVGLGLSGPGGFLVGALAAGLAAGGLYLYGRDKVASGVEKIAIPGGVLRTVFSDSRWDKLVERGRDQTRTEIRRALEQDARSAGEGLEARIRTSLEPAVRREMALDDWDAWRG